MPDILKTQAENIEPAVEEEELPEISVDEEGKPIAPSEGFKLPMGGRPPRPPMGDKPPKPPVDENGNPIAPPDGFKPPMGGKPPRPPKDWPSPEDTPDTEN